MKEKLAIVAFFVFTSSFTCTFSSPKESDSSISEITFSHEQEKRITLGNEEVPYSKMALVGLGIHPFKSTIDHTTNTVFELRPETNISSLAGMDKYDTTVAQGQQVFTKDRSGFIQYSISIVIFIIVLMFIMISNRGENKPDKFEHNYKKLIDENESLLEVINTILDDNIENSSFNSKVIEEKLGIGRAILAKWIKDETGYDVKSYILEYRLVKADEMLKSGQYNIDQITEKLGFVSQSYLIKRYKKKFGVSPQGSLIDPLSKH